MAENPKPKEPGTVLTSEEAFKQALYGQELTKVSNFALTAARNNNERCNSCPNLRSISQDWADHHISEMHISALIRKRGFCAAVRELNKQNLKILAIRCDLRDTNVKSGLYFNVYKLSEELFKRRKQEVLSLVRLARSSGSIKKWYKIAKPAPISAKDFFKDRQVCETSARVN